MLKSISPIDGRYASKTADLAEYFSEYALIKFRVLVEVEYLIALSNTNFDNAPKFSEAQKNQLRLIYKSFSEDNAQEIKNTEKVTNHDVKAVEYFVKSQLSNIGLAEYSEWVHFGLTSQDINNTATPLMIKGAVETIILPKIKNLNKIIDKLAHDLSTIPMLARTHGQPASPTTLGKEIKVFSERIKYQIDKIETYQFSGKFGGATGNFNAHKVAIPDVYWPEFGDAFLNQIGLTRQQITTQIEHYDHLAELFQIFNRISTILIDFCRDIWTYISIEYFTQKVKEGEVGSSAMPHKVNPIDFENAEGNLGITIALMSHLANKLPISRLQRDLTDSTVSRVIGVPYSHFYIALQSIEKGLSKLLVNKRAISTELDNHWAVLAEAIQNILRKEGVEKPYELLKSLTRGKDGITKDSLHTFIDELGVSDATKEKMKQLTPSNYIGYTLDDLS